MAAVTICSDLVAQENKVCYCLHCFLIYLPWSDGTRCHDLSFWMLGFKPAFSLFSFSLIKSLFSSSSLFAVRVMLSASDQIRLDQSLSRVRLFVTPWITAGQASLSITNSWISLRLTSIESVMPSSDLILCRPLLLLPPVSPSIRVFSNESTLSIRWPKY